MALSFSSFTTIFFFLITLIGMGIIFEKQILALEDKFDAWVESKRSAHKEAMPPREKRHNSTYSKKQTVKDNPHKFAA